MESSAAAPAGASSSRTRFSTIEPRRRESHHVTSRWRTRPPLLHQPWPRPGAGLRLVVRTDGCRGARRPRDDRFGARERNHRRQGLLVLTVRAGDRPIARNRLPAAALRGYLIAYKDRSAAVDLAGWARIAQRDPYIAPLLVGGRVVGGWRRTVGEPGSSSRLSPWHRSTRRTHARWRLRTRPRGFSRSGGRAGLTARRACLTSACSGP